MFPLIYWFVLDSPAAWVVYLQAAVIFSLMGLTYIQSTRRGASFMPIMAVMTAIFFLDIIAYLAYALYLARRGRREVVGDGQDRSVS